jgi:acyl carrier protein
VTTTHVTQRVARVFNRVFGEHVPFSLAVSRISEPQWTSLKHVEFIIDLEREFGVRFDGADATDMIAISVVVERLEQRLQ